MAEDLLLSAYEVARQKLINDNKAILQALGLGPGSNNVTNEISTAVKAPKAKAPKAKPKAKPKTRRKSTPKTDSKDLQDD